MKVLFICKNNIARSQIARAIFNRKSHYHVAYSAGTNVGRPGESLRERNNRKGGSLTMQVMNDNGYGIGEYVQTQIHVEKLKEYDLIVNMSGKRYTPKWLEEAPNYIYWKIRDPKNTSYDVTDSVRRQIEAKITTLLKAI